MEHNAKKKVNTFRLLVMITLLLLLLNIILAVAFISRWKLFARNAAEDSGASTYERHYALIVDSGREEFWNSVYVGAQEMGMQNGIWVERMGANLTDNYSTRERMQIAMAAKVDGILVEYSGEEAMSDLINEAAEQGIPVVTLVQDDPSSRRISHVGVSYYNLGQQYAEQIMHLLEGREEAANVFLLMNSDITDTSRTIVYSTIQETLASNEKYADRVMLNPIMVNESSSFEAEETIRDIFMNSDHLPDLIVCLDEITSACVYQALVDYNKVGSVEEIAYYSGAAILKGIEKKIIYSTTSVDTKSIGRDAVEALLEYADTGYASDYYSVDTFTIDSSNVALYMGGDADEE